MGGWDSTGEMKRERLQEQILWAEKHGVLDEVEAFLRSLSEDEWFHQGD